MIHEMIHEFTNLVEKNIDQHIIVFIFLQKAQ